MLDRGGVARYGGWLRFLVGAAIELVFSFLQGAVSTIRTSIFMMGLLFGKSVVWGGQSRDAQRLSWAKARVSLWPQTLFGVLVCGALRRSHPAVFWWSLPLTAGYLLAIPFAVVDRGSGVRPRPEAPRHLRIPEDFRPPPEIRRRPRDDSVRPCSWSFRTASPFSGADPAFATLQRSFASTTAIAARDAAMDGLYRALPRPGDLAFDIGSHVGDRIGSFRRLGARVVALEPQPLCARAIRTIYAGDKDVMVVEAACAERPGTLRLRINSANPTVSTASDRVYGGGGRRRRLGRPALG